MRRALPAVVFVIAVVAAASGCGGDKSSLAPQEYRTKLAAIAEEGHSSVSRLENAVTRSTTSAQLADAVARFGETQEQLATELADLDPPKNAASANAQLVKAERAHAAATAKLVTKLRKTRLLRDAVAISLGDADFSATGRQVNKALTALENLGYVNTGG